METDLPNAGCMLKLVTFPHEHHGTRIASLDICSKRLTHPSSLGYTSFTATRVEKPSITTHEW